MSQGTHRGDYPAPSAWIMMLEGRVVFELLATMLSGPVLVSAPRGDGHTVLLVPGFMQEASSVLPLRCYLDILGYDTHVWKQGLSGGIRRDTVSRLAEQVEVLSTARGAPVSVIGWSLGGVVARALAVHRPRCIRQVITLGSPFAGDPANNSLANMYGWINPLLLADIDDDVTAIARRSLPVPTSAIYSRSDGVVPWQHCIDVSCLDTSESIEVVSSHWGLGVHPVVMLVIADRLRQPLGKWKPLPLHLGRPRLSSLLPPFVGAAA